MTGIRWLHTQDARRGSGRASVALALATFGWLAGTGIGIALDAGLAHAGAVCTTEVWNGTDLADGRFDSTDMVDESNYWYAHDGSDYLRSLPCDDPDVVGQRDNDNIGGGSADDSVFGGLGNDDVFGGDDHDHLFGDGGDDSVTDLEGTDIDDAQGDNSHNASGEDVIHVDDGDGSDHADGQSGADICYTDAGDTRTSC